MDVNQFEGLKISIASPETIKEWSYGEVEKAETINYRTLKPERDGLFCEKIFGPVKDFECSCGKYKRLRYKGITCDRCGVDVTKAKVRRERMGHIELAAPVSHIWFFKGVPSRMGLVLDMNQRELEEILYFVSYVVLDKGDTPLEYKQVISDRDYRAYHEKYGNSFRVGIGAEAVRELLSNVNLEEESAKILVEINEIEDSLNQKRIKLIKRLDILNALISSNNRPEWMILNVIPVIPPDLRPMIQIDGGRFATSDLNDLYRRVINRNNRLKKLIELRAPSIIIQNEKRMLQEAVDALFDNGRRGRPVTGSGNRPLKSFSNMLKGKTGRFRQNLLGKRVDYSGRSVIIIGPNLKMYECGLPKEMALELFKPYIINGLIEKEIAANIKAAKRLIENRDPRIWDVVEERIKEHPVLLNRAPTLHRLGIQAFEPKLIEGNSIRIHPLVCTAFNADFDGDQMSVHVPITEEAKAEARILMLASNNILSPKSGSPIVAPQEDIILGNYYITIEKAGTTSEGRVFKSDKEAIMAYERREIKLHTRIAIRVSGFKHKIFPDDYSNKYLVTTVGKVIFNEIFPNSFQYINEDSYENINSNTPSKFFLSGSTNIREAIANMPIVSPFNIKTFEKLIAKIYQQYQTTETSIMLDKLKDVGFKYSKLSGISIGMGDIILTDKKQGLLEEGHARVAEITKLFKRGLITDKERYDKVISNWKDINKRLESELSKIIDENPTNSLAVMIKSGARGKVSHYNQMAGIKGLINKPTGDVVEIPVTTSFLEGFKVLDFFTASHGTRKGLVDTALKTADAGYLTRRLVDVVQDVIVNMEDCGTDQGYAVEAFMNNEELVESLYDRIIGRFTNAEIINPETKEVICGRNVLITTQIANDIIKCGITKVPIRTTLTCKSHKGVCQKCYGKSLATDLVVEIGEAVGVMAAQSIGEPGTQLTMKNINTGGVVGENDITQGLPRVEEIFEARDPKGKATISTISGTITDIVESYKDESENNKIFRYIITVKNNIETVAHETNYHAKLNVAVGDKIQAGHMLTVGNIYPKELLQCTNPLTVQQYVLYEVQKLYRGQGIDISDKHVEVITRRMIHKIKISTSGDSLLLPGTIIDINEYTEINKKLIIEGKKPSFGKPLLEGITKASLGTDSFLSAASFQETVRVLTDAAIRGKVDHLTGLKENVIMGKLIPAGTGVRQYRDKDVTLVNKLINEDPLEALEQELMD